MRLNDYASIIVQCCLLAQCLALQLVYCNVQGPWELGLQALQTTGSHIKRKLQTKLYSAVSVCQVRL